jgi:hypothetical protein
MREQTAMAESTKADGSGTAEFDAVEMSLAEPRSTTVVSAVGSTPLKVIKLKEFDPLF